MTVAFTLPLPPSANNLFPTGKGGRRFISPEYKAWRMEAGWELNAQRARPMKGRVKVDIAVSEACRNDLDNNTKPIVDLLVAHKIIEGDSKKHVRAINLSWEPSIRAVNVTIYPCL